MQETHEILLISADSLKKLIVILKCIGLYLAIIANYVPRSVGVFGKSRDNLIHSKFSG